MIQFFQSFFRMALEASIVALVVFAVRPLLKRYSNRIACLLWVVVMFRLLCPFAIESPAPAFGAKWEQESEKASDDETYALNVNVPKHVTPMDFLVEEQTPLTQESTEAIETAEAATESAETKPFAIVESLVLEEGLQESTEVAQTPSKSEMSASDEVIVIQPQTNDEAQEDMVLEAREEASEAEPVQRKAALTDRMGMAAVSVVRSAREWFSSVQGKSLTNICGVLWLFGAFAFLLLGLRKYLTIQGKLREAIPYKTWQKYPVKISDASGVPMSFGVLKPGIYVPASFQNGENSIAEGQQELILWHEATHLKRLDPLWKLVAFLALAVHWWNPLIWLCIRCMNQDIEMACDERVLAQVGQYKKQEYANTLLHFAADHSGLSLAAAFGESHAECRIKNALKYRKAPKWLSALLVIFVLLLGGCLATKPVTSQETTENTEETQTETTEDGYLIYDSQEGLVTDQIRRLTEKLANEAKIKEAKELTCVTYGLRGVPYKEEPKEGEHYTFEIFFSAFSRGEITYYYESFDYYEKAQDNAENRKVYVGNAQYEEIHEIDSLATAKMAQYPFGILWIEDPEAKGVPTFDGWNTNSGIKQIASIWEETAPEKVDCLKDPVRATKVLMNLGDGEGEYLQTTFESGFVKYTLKNGEELHYIVYDENGYWRPYTLIEYQVERHKEWYPDLVESDIGRYDATLQMTEYFQSVNASELRGVTKWREQSEHFWDPEDGKFKILCEIPEKDATLYGYYDGNGMILRVGDTAYPLISTWDSMGGLVELACGDYDKDDEDEYALTLEGKRGTGTYGTELYVIELRPNGAVAHKFTMEDRFGYLADTITYDFAEKDKTLTIRIKDGQVTRRELKGKLSPDGKVQELIYGCYEGVTPVDDDLFYECGGTLWTTDDSWPGDAGLGIDLMCRVDYHFDGTFTMNTPWFYDGQHPFGVHEPLEELTYSGEEILNVRMADLTRDGIDDAIVTSVSYQEETKNLSWEKRMDQGDVCFVRVYDGEGADFSQGFTAEQALWTRTLSDDKYGNGFVFLCEKNGKSYLLTGDHTIWNGDMTPNFTVLVMGPYNVYEMDSAETFVDMNGAESVWSVDDMVAFTEKLNDWISDAKLIAYVDLYGGRRISEKTFHAWEIWSSWNNVLNREIKNAKASKVLPLLGQEESVTLSGMENLRSELSKMNRNWRMLADWITKASIVSKIDLDLQDGKNVITCDITHDGNPDTITVEYGDAETDSQALILIDIRNSMKEFLWEGTLGLPHAGWGKYYVTLCDRLPYMIWEYPVSESQGEEYGAFKVFYVDDQGHQIMLEEREVSSSFGSKDYQKEKAEFEKALKKYKERAVFMVSTFEGELLVDKKPSNWSEKR